MNNNGNNNSKTLIIRLSSLGDVILATSALEAVRARGEQADWIVSREYAELLRGHPAVGRIWEFDRKQGFAGWQEICRQVLSEVAKGRYTQVIDLHRSLRATWLVARLRLSASSSVQIRRISKQRCRLYGYFLFKGLWPKALRPEAYVMRYARAAGSTASDARPNLKHLLVDSSSAAMPSRPTKPYLCVMPASRWDGKKWPVKLFADFLEKQTGLLPVVLGGKGDQESHELLAELSKRKIEAVSGVGIWDLKQVAHILAGSRGYFGNDTGLAHLAEAVGVPATLVFGPTTAAMGFGPWRPESRAVSQSLWCSPCGKDGRACFRGGESRYLCLKSLTPEMVAAQAPKWLVAVKGTHSS